MRQGLALVLSAAVAARAACGEAGDDTTNRTVRRIAPAFAVAGKTLPLKGRDGGVSRLSLFGADGRLYSVVMDDQGRKLAGMPSMQSVRIKGLTNTVDGRLQLTVLEFAPVVAATPAATNSPPPAAP